MITFREFVTNQIQMAKGNEPEFLAANPTKYQDPNVAYGHAMRPDISTALPDPEQEAQKLEKLRKHLQNKVEKYQAHRRYMDDIGQLEKLSKERAIQQSKNAITMP
jgi:siroheme synthase (precorrin-2 oxidase/ferrochelatase)